MFFHQEYPVYVCIANMLCDKVLKGDLKPNERFLSVRECAAMTGVTPNTVASAFDLLAKNEIIVNHRGVGFFVTESAVEKILVLERDHFFKKELPAFLSRAELLRINIKDYIK